jgi:hypothetical protein
MAFLLYQLNVMVCFTCSCDYGVNQGGWRMNLSKQSEAYRKSLGYSQEQLAEKLYVSRRTILS